MSPSVATETAPVAPRAGPATAHAVATSVRLWMRDCTRSMEVSPRTFAAAMIVLVAAAAGGSLALASAMPTLEPGAVPPHILIQLSNTAAGLLWAAAAASVVLFQIFTPVRTRLADLLRLLPVPRLVVTVTGMAPPLILAWVLTAAVSSPLVVMLADASGERLGIVTAAALILVAGLMPLMALLFAGTRVALQRLRLPPHHAISGAAMVGLAVALAPQIVEFAGVGWWMPSRALANAAGGDIVAWLILGAWCSGGIGVAVGGAAVLPETLPSGPSRIFARLGVPSGELPARAWYELVSLIRAPQYAAAVLFTSIAVASTLIVWVTTHYRFMPLLSMYIFVPYFLASVQSFGHTRPTHWIGTHLLASPLTWVGPKAAVTLIVSCLLTLPGAVTAVAVDLVPWSAVSIVFVHALPAWAAAMVAGVTIPYNAEQPLSVGVSVATASILYGGVTWLASYLAGAATPLSWTMAGSALLVGCYLAAARAARPPIQSV